MYFVKVDKDGNIVNVVDQISEEIVVWIPFDPANRDYQEYLAWVAEGNEAEPWA